MIGVTVRRGVSGNRGIALLLAIIITLVVFLLVASTLYVVTQGTKISGPRKVYITACEASDGAVQMAKDAIEQNFANQQVGPALLSFTTGTSLSTTVNTDGSASSTTVSLPGEVGNYTTTLTIRRLYTRALTGSTIEFPPKAFTGKNVAVFFRIDAITTGANSVSCTNAVMYRHVI
jgi:Tfp pilus assembly protein PilX